MKKSERFRGCVRIDIEGETALQTKSGSRLWLNILVGFALWTIYGAFCASLTHYRMWFWHKPISWGEAFFIELTYAYCAGALSPLVILLAKQFPLRRPDLWRNLTIHVIGTSVFAVLATLGWNLVTKRGVFSGGQFSLEKLSTDLGLDLGVLLYWLIVMLFHTVDYYRRYQVSLVEAASLNAQLARAQLRALKMQLHPHFLFNSLHTISELIHEDPAAAERMIVGLSQLLRLTLDTSADVEVTLRQELRFVEMYLEIERTRFESRLQVQTEIEDGLCEAMVPNLILQPLVENSIKHGISNRGEGGLIRLTARRDGDSLLLGVRDNGAGLGVKHQSAYREGIGLGTTRARLDKLYGGHQSLYFVRRQEVGVEVMIRMPLRFEHTEVEKV